MGGKTAQQIALADHVSGQCNTPLSKPAHSLSSHVVLEELRENPSRGLTAAEAADRLLTHGPNQLKEKKGVQPIAIFIEQIFNAMTLVSL
jgi:magnesium-transporting ATPase (P-type)